MLRPQRQVGCLGWAARGRRRGLWLAEHGWGPAGAGGAGSVAGQRHPEECGMVLGQNRYARMDLTAVPGHLKKSRDER